jgi:hypothetical protein
MRRPRQLFRWLSLLAAGALFAEAALQVVYRVANGSWLIGRQPYKVEHIIPQEDERGYSYKPNFRDEREGVSINRFGFRMSPSVPEPEPGSDVIVSLGDSVPYGHGLKDEETYPFELGELMKQAGSPLAVINAGVQSYNLQQSIGHFYRDVLATYRPVVVTLQTANDVALLLTYRGRWTPATTWAPYRTNVPSLLGSSAAFHYLTRLALSFASTSGEGGLLAYPLDGMLANEERLLQELIGVCAAKGMKLILMPINPFYYQTKGTERNDQLSRWGAWKAETMGWQPVIERFNDVLIRVARQYGPGDGVYLFDVRAYLDDQEREPLYTDYIHHSPEGNRRVAQGLFEFMKATGIVGS